MSTWNHFCTALLATYLLHSTLLLVATAAICRCLSARWLSQRLLLQIALLGGIASTAAATLLPDMGWTWNLQLVAESAAVPDRVPLPAERSQAGRSLASTVDAPAHAATQPPPTLARPAAAASDRTSQVVAPWAGTLAWLWLAVFSLLFVRLVYRAVMVQRLARSADCVRSGHVYSTVERLARRWPLRRVPHVFISRDIPAPMAAGLWSLRLYLPAKFVERLDRQQLEALVAHELAHLSRRDPLWSLLHEFFCCCFFFQPLNFWVRHRLRQLAEFLADRDAVDHLAQGLGLARCLAAYAEWALTGGRAAPRTAVAAVGMAARPSLLARRVQVLLDNDHRPARLSIGRGAVPLAVSVWLALTMFGPRVIAEQKHHSSHSLTEGTVMLSSKSLLTALAVTVGLGTQAGAAPAFEVPAFEAAAGEEKVQAEKAQAERAAEIRVDGIPDGMDGFRGMLTGEAVRADAEQGVLLLKVARIERTWPQNKARNPRAAVGKTLRFELSPEFPRLLDRHREFLGTIKHGDRIELEAFAIEGQKLVIVEELKRAAAESSESPGESPGETAEERTGFPDGLRGFSGQLVGQLISKDAEKGELKLKVYKVARVWRGNRATRPESAVGRTFLIDGISGKWIDSLITVKEGDGVEIEAKHVSGENLQFLGEGFKKTELPAEEPAANEDGESTGDAKKTGIPEQFVGFRGMLAGKVVATDVEKGWMEITVERVPHVWKPNKAEQPQSIVGRTVRVEGIFGKFLDNLLVLRPGDRVEVEANHLRGEALTFPGEWLKKIE
jgi:beta-lactamase regulating signal transducer with metallopeptidase domain